MTNLKQLFSKRLTAVRGGVVVAILIIALIGFADSAYLTLEHFRGVIPPCSVVEGCEQVLTSEYSAVFGIPVALFGALYYLLIAVSAFIYLESKMSGRLGDLQAKILKGSLLFTVFGLLASLWFVYLQAFVIHSYCVYCLGSVATSTILFIIAMEVLRRQPQNAV